MTEIMRIDPAQPSPQLIDKATEVIQGGGVIIYPTETLYGLGANPLDTEAMKKIYTIKGRLVHTLPIEDGATEVDWNLQNWEGKDITRGIYIYILSDAQGTRKSGKLVITR